MNMLQEFAEKQLKPGAPVFRPGDTLKVWVKIKEGDKERLQAFEGICIRRHRAGNCSTFTVRKISYGIGVERIFPLHSPVCDKIEVIRLGHVRRSRLYYLRGLRGKAARVKAKKYKEE